MCHGWGLLFRKEPQWPWDAALWRVEGWEGGRETCQGSGQECSSRRNSQPRVYERGARDVAKAGRAQGRVVGDEDGERGSGPGPVEGFGVPSMTGSCRKVRAGEHCGLNSSLEDHSGCPVEDRTMGSRDPAWGELPGGYFRSMGGRSWAWRSLVDAGLLQSSQTHYILRERAISDESGKWKE